MALDREEMLKLNINLMKFVWVWPKNEEELKSKCKTYRKLAFLLVSVLPIVWGILGDMYRQVALEMCDDFEDIIENILTLICLFTFMYYTSCLYVKQRKLINLKSILLNLEYFDAPPDQEQIERTVRFITKYMIFYDFLGISMYAMLPMLYYHECEETRIHSKYSQDVVCGLFTRLWYPFRIDYFPVYEIVFICLTYTSCIFVCISSFLVLLQTGYVLHIVGHIKNLKTKLQKAFHSENIRKELDSCMNYHIRILDFCTALDDSYRSCMLIHICVTSVVLSILAYELVSINSMFDCIRFFIHMLGWLTILFLACWNGQKLIDESVDVAVAAYNTDWPDAEVSIQTDIILIILRAQKPLVLRAASFGHLSYETFMAIISTSYSYFTLLANFS